jgi:CBS domain-containing protein
MAGIILIKEAMTRDVKKVRTDTSMQEVIATMLKFDISSVVVVQKDRPIGLITHKDILLKMIKPGLLPNVLTAINVMSTPIITVKEEQSIDEAAKLMAEK